MKFIPIFFAMLVTQIPKYSPNGIWESGSGSQYELRLDGSDLHVRLVPGSNPRFLQYEVDAKNQEEVNTYKGTGFFVAKMKSGKECKLTTEWQLVVVSPERILGITTSVTADPDTCEVIEKGQSQLDLKKKK
jgi:hypothetical protein